MKGSKFLKVTGILMIIGSAMVVLLGVIVAGFGALAAGVGAASGLTGNYFLALLATLVGGICQLVAGIMGVKHCKNPQKAKLLIIWGVLVVLFGIQIIVTTPSFRATTCAWSMETFCAVTPYSAPCSAA